MEQKNENKIGYHAELFSNRLAKRYRALRKWARRNEISCYRVYDRDIPEIPLALDLYEFLAAPLADKTEILSKFADDLRRISQNDSTIENELKSRRYAVMFLYEKKDYDVSEEWLSYMAKAAASSLNIDISHIFIKTRRHEKGGGQYADVGISQKQVTGIVAENKEIFFVNLTDYIDTGIFFDHRPLRSQVRKMSSGKSVLNLFCYTSSFSVYAASGGASRVESVDLSNTYLSWAKENMKLNDFSDINKYFYTKSDVAQFLFQKKDEIRFGKSRPYDIIILDPPTFSNSKMSRDTLDINRDWQNLVNASLEILAAGGMLFFSTNSRRLKFDSKLIKKQRISIEEITDSTIPEDFSGKKAHRVWKINA